MLLLVWRVLATVLGLCRGGDLCGLYSTLSQDGKMVVEEIPLVVWGCALAVLWQSGWGYILPVWPCPGVSSDGATVSPDPSCLSLQYLSVGGLGSVISGVLLLSYPVSCVNLSMLSLILSFSLSLGGPEP